MKISNRLKEISKFIDNKRCTVDVGCDHALLPIYLIKEGKSLSAIAVDNKIEPLESAKENIRKYNLESKIKTILSDGLTKVDPSYYDSVVITGLGGETIAEILRNGPLSNSAELILEANKNNKELRSFLSLNSFLITDEVMIKDKGHFYTIIKAVKTDKPVNLTENEILFGPIILKDNSDIFKEYLAYNISILERQLNDNNKDEIEKKISIYKGVLK